MQNCRNLPLHTAWRFSRGQTSSVEHTLLEAIYEFLPIIMNNWRETETLQAEGDCCRVQPQAALEPVSAAEPDNVLPLAVEVEFRCWY